MPSTSIDSFLVCSTPRTGSTLLCSLLKSTGVAGFPESYFRRQDLSRWAKTWGLLRPNGEFEFPDYVQATIRAGRSENGVFAARIMWGTMNELTSELRKSLRAEPMSDNDLLQHTFGRTKFIHLQRDDIVAQSVSRLIAEQTHVWHSLEGTAPTVAKDEPIYDFSALSMYVQEAREHLEAWESWFRSNDLQSHKVTYGQLDTDPNCVVREVLDFLEIAIPTNCVLYAPNRRLANELNENWIARFRAEYSSKLAK